LRQRTALPADTTKVDAARLLARQAALEQDHGASGVAASKEERSGRTHDAAADHDHIGSVISQRRALL
jgi:hypothetical protein